MFAYCGNNPVARKDEGGEIWNYVIAGAVSAAVNVITTYVAAKVTGQEYTLLDAGVAALAGAVNVIPVVGTYISGAITGVYAGTMAYSNGASLGAAIGCGVVAGVCTTASIGNLANATGGALDLATGALVDLVFGTGYNCISAATYKAVTTPKSSTSTNGLDNPTKTIHHVIHPQQKRNRAVSIEDRKILTV